MKIDPLIKGDTKRTARKADVVNEIINNLNNVLNAEFIPAGAAKMTVTEGKILIDLSGVTRMIGSENLYYIKDGVLWNGNFAVSGQAEV